MIEPTTHTLDVPGAVLTYDVRRNASSLAPILLLIGSPMGASGFGNLAGHFADRTVVTYDPRGVERSTRTDDAVESTPDQHADDLYRLITTLDAGAVEVFATSGGAVNAMALVARHPEQVRTLVAHEPPAAQVVPDRQQALVATRDIQKTYQRSGFGPAMAKFIALVSHKGLLPADYADRPAPDPAMFGLPTEDDGSRNDPLLMQNMVSGSHYRLDFDALRLASTRIVIATGAESEGQLAHRATVAIGEHLGTMPVTFPGGHAGFLDDESGEVGGPGAFAATLRRVLDIDAYENQPRVGPIDKTTTPQGEEESPVTTGISEASGNGEYAEVDGLNLYYETYGTGRPLILLHGGLMSGEMFGPILPALMERHQVIVPDLQGHGRTADIDRPIDIRLMADDIAALIDHLGLDKPDLVGYSMGGGVAFFTASRYSDKVGKLVMASANIRRDAIPPEMLAQQGQVNAAAVEFMKETPMYQLYEMVAPRPQDFGRLLDKLGEAMSKDFDFSEEVRALKVPTLIVAADADMAPPRHYVEVFELLDGGLRDGGWMGEGRPKGGHALAILPGLTHYNLGVSPLFAAVALDFLNPRPRASVG